MKVYINKVEVFVDRKVQISSYEPVSLKLGYTADVEDAENIKEVNGVAEQLISEVKNIVNKEINKIIEEEMARTKSEVNVGTTENVSVKVNNKNYQPAPAQPTPPVKKDTIVYVNYNKSSFPLNVTQNYDNDNYKNDMVCPVCGGKLYKNTNKKNGNVFFGCANWKTTGCKFSANLDDIKELVEQQNVLNMPPIPQVDDFDLPQDLPQAVPMVSSQIDDDDIPF